MSQVDWRHVNFLGGARTAGVLARYSGLDRGVRLNFRQPYLFGPRYDLERDGAVVAHRRAGFTLDTNGGRVTVTRQFRRGGGPVLGSRPSQSLSLMYMNETREVHDLERGARGSDLPGQPDRARARSAPPGQAHGTRSALALDGGRNTTNNLLDARRGYVAHGAPRAGGASGSAAPTTTTRSRPKGGISAVRPRGRRGAGAARFD